MFDSHGGGNGTTVGNLSDYTIIALPDDQHEIRRGQRVARDEPVRQMVCAFGKKTRQTAECLRGRYSPLVLVDWKKPDGTMHKLTQDEYDFAGVCITDGDHMGIPMSLRAHGAANLLNTGTYKIHMLDMVVVYAAQNPFMHRPFSIQGTPKYATTLPIYALDDLNDALDGDFDKKCVFNVGIAMKDADPGGMTTVVLDMALTMREA
jgi:hypothetical protein